MHVIHLRLPQTSDESLWAGSDVRKAGSVAAGPTLVAVARRIAVVGAEVVAGRAAGAAGAAGGAARAAGAAAGATRGAARAAGAAAGATRAAAGAARAAAAARVLPQRDALPDQARLDVRVVSVSGHPGPEIFGTRPERHPHKGRHGEAIRAHRRIVHILAADDVGIAGRGIAGELDDGDHARLARRVGARHGRRVRA